MAEQPNQAILSRRLLKPFKYWLIRNGWTILDNGANTEVLRASRVGRRYPVILYDNPTFPKRYSVYPRDVAVINNYLRKGTQ